MEQREFIIPQSLDDLQLFSDAQYYVQEAFDIVQIKEDYLGCRLTLQDEGVQSFINDKFDLLYSCLQQFSSLSWKIVHELWEVCVAGLKDQVETLRSVLKADSDIDDQIRIQMLRNFKMNFFIFSEIIIKCEDKTLFERNHALPSKNRRKVVDSNSWNWNSHKVNALAVLYSIVQLPLQHLWKTANVSEDFLDEMVKCCLKLLEDREIAFVVNKSLRESIFQILSILCKNYTFGLALMPRIIQMLMLYEHLAAPLAQSVCQMEGPEGNTGLMRLALQEMCEDLAMINDESQNKAGQNCAQFLIELGKVNPAGLAKHLPLIIQHLERDPYHMRMGVLELFGNLLVHVYNDPEISESQQQEKQMMLDYLLEHLYDVTAGCRSKVLQVWKQLCEEEVVSVSLLLTVLEKMQVCILDKTSTTRKDAIKFLKTVLEHNPFASKLHPDELKKQLAKTADHLSKMEQKAGIATEGNDVFWQSIRDEVAEKVASFVAAESAAEDFDQNEEAKDDAVMVRDLYTIAQLLKSRQFESGVRAGYVLIRTYDTQNVIGVIKNVSTTTVSEKELCGDNSSSSNDDDDDDKVDKERTIKALNILLHAACMLQSQEPSDIPEEMKAELKKQKDLLKFLQQSLRFAELVNSSVENVLMVLETSQTTELSEAIELVATAQQFCLLSEQQGLSRLLSFVHSKDQSLRNTVTAAYCRIYLPTNEASSHEELEECMQKVCSLVQQSPVIYVHSLVELVQAWVATRDITQEAVDVLWEMMTRTKKEESIGAANLLHMVLYENPQNVRDHLVYLQKIGFGKRAEDCFQLAENSCKVLARVSPLICSDQDEDPYKLHRKHEVFQSLSNIIVNGSLQIEDQGYCDFVSQAMFAIFKVCQTPSCLVSNITRQLVALYEPLQHAAEPLITQNHNSGQTQDLSISQVALARLLVVVGSIARNLLTFLMEEVLVELRRHKILSDKKVQGKAADEEAENSDSSMVSEIAIRTVFMTEEEALDRINSTCNHEVLGGRSILGQFLPIIEEVCQNPGTFTHPALQVAAAQALGRCMMLSQTYCSKKLRLLCTLMLKSQDYRVRITMIYCMGDLLRRFPNEADPYSPTLYECLKDDNMDVRREGLVVLSKLILSDMVRVKFQISYLAACLTDADPCCQDIASYFFATLATKGNILYNLVIDMISQLSGEGSDKNQKDFETIMRVILPYIEKESQVVVLVEKLCSRFPEKTSEEECCNLALCISILPLTLKCIKSLKESFHFYAERLKFVKVKMTFDAIVQNARKQSKVENKDILDHFQLMLDGKSCDKAPDTDEDLPAATEPTATPRNQRLRNSMQPPSRTVGSQRRTTRRRTNIRV